MRTSPPDQPRPDRPQVGGTPHSAARPGGARLSGVGLVHPNGHRALRSVSLTVAAGERLAIIGPSGAGKTTLLRVLGASLRPGEGHVELLGETPWSLASTPLKRLRARIGMVHQAAPIPPRLRVVTAVLAGRLGTWPLWKALGSLAYPADVAGASQALARMGLAGRVFDRCDRLSGGQLQRVGIARVLYQGPDLLLADEPVSALDPTSADAAIEQLVLQTEATGTALIASLHAVDLALKWFPRIVGMRGGEVVFDLPVGNVSDATLRSLYAAEGSRLPTQGDRTRDGADQSALDIAPANAPVKEPGADPAANGWLPDDHRATLCR